MTTLLPLPLFRSSCAIRPCRMPHLHFIYKIYHTAHAANAAYVRSMYTPHWPPSPCAIRVCAYDKGVDYMTASFVFIISFAHCVYQHFKHLFYVVPLPPWRAVGIVVYKLQLTTAQRTFAHTSLPNHKPTNYVPHWQRATCNWQLPPRCT